MVYICKGMFLAGDAGKPTELTALQMGNIQVWNKEWKKTWSSQLQGRDFNGKQSLDQFAPR